MSAERRILALAAVLGLAACGSGAGPGSDQTTILDPGSGEANVEPLWPLHTGYGIYGSGGGAPIVLLPPRELDGRVVSRWIQGFSGAEQYAAVGPAYVDRTHPAQPMPMQYLSQDEDGVWFHGKLRGGILANPVLLVPREVRVGMRWEARVSGERRFVFEVAARNVEDTPFGRRPVWTIQSWDANGYAVNFTTGETEFGVVSEARYVEGRGPLPLDLGNDGSRLLAVVPLEEPPAAAAAPRIEPVALADGAAIMTGFYPIFTSAILDPAAGGRLDLQLYARGDGDLRPADAPSTVCFQFDPADDRLAVVGSECVEAAGTSIGADGSIAQIYVASAELVASFPEGNCTPGSGGFCFTNTISGIFRAPDGRARVVIGADDLLAIGDHDGTLDYDNAIAISDYGAVLSRIPSFTPSPGGLSGAPLRWVAADPDGLTIGKPTQGRLGVARMDAAEVVRGVHVATHLAGHLSILSSPDGMERIRTSPDGTIERIRLGPDGPTIEPLGAIDLPGDEFLFAAFEYQPGELLLLTNRAFSGSDWLLDPALSPNGHLALGETLAWRATIPPPVAAAPPVVDGITAVAVGPDLRVCWAPGAGDAVLDGWTLAGVPPAAVVPAGVEGNCVLLVRGWPEPVNLTVTGSHAAEGDIPGVGRVALGLGPVQLSTGELATEDPIAPLAEGGSVGPHVHYGPGVTPGVPHLGYDAALFGATRCPDGLIDQAGAGLWCPANPLVTGYSLALVDGDGVHPMTLGAGETVTHAAGGGGVVIQSGARFAVLHPDGSRAPLGADGLVVTAGGIACGYQTQPTEAGYDGVITCTDAAGVAVTGTLEAGRALADVISTGDVVYAGFADPPYGVTPEPALARFTASDPSEILEIDYADLGIPVAIGASAHVDLAVAPDRTAYAVFTVDDDAHVQRYLFRLDPAGPVALDDHGALGVLAQTRNVRFSVDNDLFSFRAPDVGSFGIPDYGAAAIVRVPREP